MNTNGDRGPTTICRTSVPIVAHSVEKGSDPLHDADFVLQSADAGDVDRDHVPGLERESVVGNDTGAGEQDDAAREVLRAKQKVGELIEASLDLANGRLTIEDRLASSLNVQGDGPPPRVGL